MLIRRTIFRTLLLTALFAQTSVGYAQKVGLVLSGGGSRGLAHVGVLKALEENGIPIDYIAGSSMGALVGGLYAAGYTPAQIEIFIKSNEFKKATEGTLEDNYLYYFKHKADDASLISIRFSKDSLWQVNLPTSLINPLPMDFAMVEHLSAAAARANYNFDSLFVPYRCTASDIESKSQVVFKKGNLGECIRASIAFPFYITPVVIDGHMMFDGGLYNNFPADALLNDFYPDIIIGCNVTGGNDLKPNEDSFISQLRAMVANLTDYSVKCDNGILIEPNLNDVDIFDFNNADYIVDVGYKSTLSKINAIKNRVNRRTTAAELAYRRNIFLKKQRPLLIDSIKINGLKNNEKEYVLKTLNPTGGPIYMTQLKKNYFKLTADNNIKRIFPKLQYNNQTGSYDLLLNIKRGNNFITQFGGDISSRPINEGFISLQYNHLGQQATTMYGNIYFGKLYNAGQIKARIDIPSKIPFYIEPSYTINRFDFFNSTSIAAFIQEEKPSYLIRTDQNTALNIGLPARSKGKFVFSGSLLYVNDQYYQTGSFTKNDTTDQTSFLGNSVSVAFERNTLNRKQYASEGTYLNIKIKRIQGAEQYTPGSTSKHQIASEFTHQGWYQLKLNYVNYYKKIGNVRLGFLGESVFSNQPFFSNYYSTILSAPAFSPTSDSRTFFQPNFSTNVYASLGSVNIVSLTKNLDLRLEGYVYQPYQEILEDLNTHAAYYGRKFDRRFLIGSANLVYNTPLGPGSLSLNYYDGISNPISILFHFGFILFNEKALD